MTADHPPKIGMFGDDQNIHHHDYWDHAREDPSNWPDERWSGAIRRQIGPEHELHTAQEGWVPFKEDHSDPDTDPMHYLHHPVDYSTVPDHELPKTARISGKDWIAHGHHRLMADRRLGRPTTVLHWIDSGIYPPAV